MKSLTELKAEAFDNYIEAARRENANQEMKIAANCLAMSLAGLKVREYDIRHDSRQKLASGGSAG